MRQRASSQLQSQYRAKWATTSSNRFDRDNRQPASQTSRHFHQASTLEINSIAGNGPARPFRPGSFCKQCCCRDSQLRRQATTTLPNRQRSVRYLFIPTLHRTNGRRSFNHFGQCQGMALCKKEGALFVLMCSFRGLARLSI